MTIDYFSAIGIVMVYAIDYRRPKGHGFTSSLIHFAVPGDHVNRLVLIIFNKPTTF